MRCSVNKTNTFFHMKICENHITWKTMLCEMQFISERKWSPRASAINMAIHYAHAQRCEPTDTRRGCDVESTSLALIQRRDHVVCPVGRERKTIWGSLSPKCRRTSWPSVIYDIEVPDRAISRWKAPIRASSSLLGDLFALNDKLPLNVDSMTIRSPIRWLSIETSLSQ